MRASADRVFELARHLTWRDREIATSLYDHQVLSTGQLELLFFSSRRRCQDRLLFLYRERVIDRFYPHRPFGCGKPQAHWLLDEAGAILVAASRGVEPKQLGWQRREDWASHTHLAHRLGANQFVCDLVAAALTTPCMGVTAWDSTRRAAERLANRRDGQLVRPDAGLILNAPAGAVECFLEWDRGTEPQQQLETKIERYRAAESRMHDHTRMCSVLFVVPGSGRIETLRRAYAALESERERRRQDIHLVSLDGRWPMLATTTAALQHLGPLGKAWVSIADPYQPACALTELPVSQALGRGELESALGRRWRHEARGFWQRLSPLHNCPRLSPAADLHELKHTGASDLLDHPKAPE
ncbi:MAG: replication-relaxation family protein [Solirubrobacteraceae bacterium]